MYNTNLYFTYKNNEQNPEINATSDDKVSSRS